MFHLCFTNLKNQILTCLKSKNYIFSSIPAGTATLDEALCHMSMPICNRVRPSSKLVVNAQPVPKAFGLSQLVAAIDQIYTNHRHGHPAEFHPTKVFAQQKPAQQNRHDWVDVGVKA